MPLFAKSEKKERCDLIKLSCAFAFSMSGLLYIVGFTMVDSAGDLKRHSNDNRESLSALGRAFNASDVDTKIGMLSGGEVSLWCEKKEGGSKKMQPPASETEFGLYLKRGCYVAHAGTDEAHPGHVIYPKLDAGLK